jgi:hypothetical protein
MKRFPFWIPAHLSSAEKMMLQLRERHAVREAECQVDKLGFAPAKHRRTVRSTRSVVNSMRL